MGYTQKHAGLVTVLSARNASLTDKLCQTVSLLGSIEEEE